MVIKHRCKEYEGVGFIFYFLPRPYLRAPVTRGSSLARPISAYLSGLSAIRIFTRIYRSVLGRFATTHRFFSHSKASVLRSRVPGGRDKEEERDEQEKDENKTAISEWRYEREFLY